MLLHWSQTIQSIVCLLHHSILLLVSFHVLCRDSAFKRDLIKQTTSVVNCISIIKSRNERSKFVFEHFNHSILYRHLFSNTKANYCFMPPNPSKKERLRKLTLCCFIGLEILAQPHHLCRLRYLIYFLIYFLVIE